MMTDPKLLETLAALAGAIAAVVAVAEARSVPAARAATSVVDRHLAEVGCLIDDLRSADQQAPAEGPTLFGQPVGDGLDTERAQARLAIGLLRSIVNDHMVLRSNGPEALAAGKAVIVDFGGCRSVSRDRLDLVLALYDPDHGRD